MAVAYPTNPAPQRPLGVSPYASYAAFDPAAYAAEQKASLAAFDPQAYSAQFQQEQAARSAEREALDRYIAEQSAKGIETASLNAAGGGPMGTSGVFGLPDFGPRFDPTNPTATTGQVVRFDQGQMNAPVVYKSGDNYVLTDATGEKVLGRASSVEELQDLAVLQEAQPFGFQLYRGDAQGDYTVGNQLFDRADPRVGGIGGALLKYGLPLATAFIPGLNVLGAMAAAGGSSAIGNIAAGENLKTALISGALSAGTAGLMRGTPLGDVFGSTAGKAVEKGVEAGAKAAAAPVLGEILVSAARQATPGVLSNLASTAASGALSSALTNNASQYQPQPGDAPLVTGTGYRYPTDSLLSNTGSVLGAGLGAGLGSAPTSPPPLTVQQPTPEPPATEGDEIVVTANPDFPGGFPSVPFPSLTVPNPVSVPDLAVQPTTPGETFEQELTVEAPREPLSVINTPAIPFPPLTVPNPVNVPDLSVQPTPEAPATEGDEIVVTANPQFPGSLEGLVAPLVTLGPSAIPGTAATTAPKKLGVTDYLKLAGLASSALGALGGGGGTPAGTIPGGLGGLNPIFSSQLPTANIPGGVGAASNLAPRQMGEEDWLTYGQRPERSFYNYVPQQPTGMAHGGSLEAKRGGSSSRTSFAVNGPGTGRSDDIPAVLSDGEYVIDAETVALLGDGSSKAGAQKLDDLRVKIRKHKGQKLSQGRFSANAKKPEAYLSGGRI